MSEVIKIDSKTLKFYFNDFTREKNKFKNTSYNGFKSSYLNTCGDAYVRRMANNLNPLYTKINTGYENINTWWEKYIKEAEATENSITNNNISGVGEGTIISALSRLPKLQDFILNNITFSLNNQTGDIYNKQNNNIFQNLINIFGEAKIAVEGLSTKVVNSISNAKNKALDWWNNEAVAVLRNGALMYNESVKVCQDTKMIANASVAGTVSNVGLSLVEGVGKFGEAMMDSIVSVGSLSAQATMFQQVNELEFQGINTGIALDEYNKNIQEGTQAFVSKELVTSAFNNFYETNGMGQYIKENAIAFDTVRSIGNGVGYMAGTAALSMFTFGGSAVGMAATAATAGVGKGTEEAWKNGATYNEGLTYGAATGAWEGLQYYVGAKLIGQSNIFGREGSKLFIDGSRGKVLESAARVVMDAIDSGSEGIVQPFLQSLYVDGYYDENGDYINFSGEDSFAKVWYETFLDNGGWTNVATQAAMGGIGSLIGEALDLGRYFKDKDTNVETNNKKIFENSEAEVAAKKVAENVHLVNNAAQKLKKIKNINEFLEDPTLLELFNPRTSLNLGFIEEADMKQYSNVLFESFDLFKSALDSDEYISGDNIKSFAEIFYTLCKVTGNMDSNLFYKFDDYLTKYNYNYIKFHLNNLFIDGHKSYGYKFLETTAFLKSDEFRTKMIDAVSPYIDSKEALERLNKFRIDILTSSEFREQHPNSGFAVGLNGHDYKDFVALKLSDNYIKQTTIHELLHQISRKNSYISGIDGRATRGLNEAITEYFAKKFSTVLFDLPPGTSGYDTGVDFLKKFIQSGVVDEDSLLKSYFSGDISFIFRKFKENSNFNMEIWQNFIESMQLATGHSIDSAQFTYNFVNIAKGMKGLNKILGQLGRMK